MKISTGGSNVDINGQEYVGRTVIINDGKVIVDGIEQSESLDGQVIITINGNVESIDTHFGTVNVSGNADVIKTMSGDVHCHDVSGHVNTMSGDIFCGNVNGNATTMSGNIIKK